MGQATQEDKVRNEAMFNDYKSGLSFIDLVAKYRVSSQRVWQIIKREEERAKFFEVVPSLEDEETI